MQLTNVNADAAAIVAGAYLAAHGNKRMGLLWFACGVVLAVTRLAMNGPNVL